LRRSFSDEFRTGLQPILMGETMAIFRHGRARMGLFVKLEFCIFSAAALFSVGLA